MAEPIGKHIKLTGPWEIIQTEDGMVHIACNHPNEAGGTDRFILALGSSLYSPNDLEEGINFIRSKGEFSSRLN